MHLITIWYGWVNTWTNSTLTFLTLEKLFTKMPKINKKDETLQYYKLCDMGRFIISLTKSEKSKFRIFLFYRKEHQKWLLESYLRFSKICHLGCQNFCQKSKTWVCIWTFLGTYTLPTHLKLCPEVVQDTSYWSNERNFEILFYRDSMTSSEIWKFKIGKLIFVNNTTHIWLISYNS